MARVLAYDAAMTWSRAQLSLLLAVLTLGAALAPGMALARAGGGASMGSRGMRTFSAPAPTRVAPSAPEGIERSFTPRTSEAAPAYAPPAYAPGYAGRPGLGGFGASPGRSAFASGLMGGLIGAGIGGMLFGHGMFGGIDGAGSVLGLLLQLALVVLLVRWVVRRLAGRGPMLAGLPGMGGAARMAQAPGAGPRPVAGGTRRTASVTIGPADYQAFERLLHRVQEAWSAQDLRALQGLTTPEMLGYFSEQLSEHASRGRRNSVADVRLDAGDLSEAWAEGSREYATVAMRYSMLDVTRDARGAVVDGSLAERVSVVELWTFLRAQGGAWVLAAIQQGR